MKSAVASRRRVLIASSNIATVITAVPMIGNGL